ncbi:MAG: signal peptidase I [Patescibacteria group bacterium]|nr:signal peptidase I [Patescibacteria group bacterium]
MHKAKFNKSSFLTLILVGIIVVLVVFLFRFTSVPEPESEVIVGGIPPSAPCFSVEEKIVRGDSMSGIIEPGKTVKILSGYYKCNEVKRGDVIVYFYAGNTDPLIKIVKGIPGDKFGFQKISGGWYILLNGKILKNAQDRPYILDGGGYRMLSLYEHDYKGIIPKDAYLILGNLVGGSIDSTRFGLVGKIDILGKAVY